MARFVFDLEPVLRQRVIVERQRQKAVAQLETRRIELETYLRRMQSGIEQERADLRQRFGAGGSGSVGIADLRVQANATLFMVGKAQTAAVELAGVLKRLEAARGALAEAMAARRGIEHLKETRYAAWLSEQKRRETAELDELGMRRARGTA